MCSFSVSIPTKFQTSYFTHRLRCAILSGAFFQRQAVDVGKRGFPQVGSRHRRARAEAPESRRAAEGPRGQRRRRRSPLPRPFQRRKGSTYFKLKLVGSNLSLL